MAYVTTKRGTAQENDIARAIETSVQEVIEAQEVTADLGGELNTFQAAQAVQKRVLAKL